MLKSLTDRALGTAELLGATYADVRICNHTEQTVNTNNGVVETVNYSQDLGFGVRVIADGAWGFASSAHLTVEEGDRVTTLAVNIARASALVQGNEGINLGPRVSNVDRYQTPVEIDPFTISLEEKIDLLLKADVEMRRVQGIRVAQGNVVCQREIKTFANSEGSFIEQEIIETGCGIVATAVGDGEIQKRSYPNAFGRHQMTRGWEFVLEMDLPAHAERIASEATALLRADQCPSKVTTLILGGAQLALQVHESCGHPIELDRVFGTEAAYVGTSFLTPEKLNTFQYGSQVVNLTADATLTGGLGTFGFDDEGIPAQRIPIVRDGLFVGYLSCDDDHWVIWGTPNCGKGQPGQVAHTGHGAAPARFRNVQVGLMS